MQENTRLYYAIGMALLIIILGLAGYSFVRKGGGSPSTQPTPTNSGTSTAQAPGNVIVSGGVTASDSGNAGIPMPSLSRSYTPPADAPKSVQTENKKIYANAVAQLRIDPNHIGYWIVVGQYRQNAKDYTGAEEIWLYLIKRWPTDPTAYGNLADMYGNYMHEYDKAVVYYNKLIDVRPSEVSAYINLATIYNINLHDAASAKATLEKGLKNNPNNPTLQYALSALK